MTTRYSRVGPLPVPNLAHFDLSYTPVRFPGCVLHGCDTTVLPEICPQTDIKTLGKRLKIAPVIVPATMGVSRNTFCHDNTQ